MSCPHCTHCAATRGAPRPYLAEVRRVLDARPGEAFDLESLTAWLSIPHASRSSASVQKQLGAALHACGYRRVRRRIGGVRRVIWFDDVFGLDVCGEMPRIHVSP